MTSPSSLTCGNDDRGQPESSCRPGPDGGIRTAALHHLAGMVTASRCGPEVPAPQPQPPRTSPADRAAGLNPHKTELNPHKAAEAASRARTDQTGLPSSGQSPPARQLAQAELSRRPRSAVPMTPRHRHGPSLRTRSRPIRFARFESSATRVPRAERDDLHAVVRGQQAVTAGLALPCSSAAMEGNVSMSR